MRTEHFEEKHESIPVQETYEIPASLENGNPQVDHENEETAEDPLVQPGSVDSIYENHDNDFADFANSAKLQNESKESDILNQTPFIPSEVYSNLPVILTEGCKHFKDYRERDVFLTGALCILSGCLPSITGIYDKQTIYPNLFCFIIAPAASGKGALKFSKNLADKIHERALKNSQEAEEVYQVEMERYQDSRRSRRKNGCQISNRPVQPKMQVLFIPANSSYAKILWHLKQNEGGGIICETEADTMANVLKQDWGHYSDMLRKSFHHESLSSSKKTDNEYNEVKYPRLSVALSGTPSQVPALISSSEDGMFSRFIFYAFNDKPFWKDVSPDGINLNAYFEALSSRVLQLYDFSERNPASVELTTEQWYRLNSTCQGWLDHAIIFNGNEAASVVKRLGIILFRIAMILTAIRKFEDADHSDKVTCTDEDFETAIRLSEVYMDHSIFMFNNLPQKENSSIFNGHINKEKFFNDLPNVFKRSEAIAIGTKHGIKERTVDDLLRKLSGNLLKQENFGKYSKIIDKVNNVTNKNSII
jgi:hypothetical protein